MTLPRALRKRNVYEEVARFLDIPGGQEIVQESYAQLRKFNCWNISIVQQYARFKQSRNEVLTAVTDQIIRSGIFQDKAFTEAFPFTLRLRLIRNPNMALNGRFPTAVGDFKYEINR